MAKGSGTTRNVGPAQAAGGRAQAPADQNAEWRSRESSEKYSLDPEKVRFTTVQTDLGDITPADLRTRGNYEFEIVTRDMSDGRFNLSDFEWLMPSQETTFSAAIKAAVQEAKNRYMYAGRFGTRDSKIRVDTEDGNLSAWVDSELTADNRVKISISRFKL